VKFGSLRKKLRKQPGAIETVLATSVDIEPQLIPAEAVAIPAALIASTAFGVVRPNKRSLPFSKTPSAKRKRAPRRGNLRTNLVKGLRKRKRELTKELGEVKRDLKSLRAK